jgi:hypothetical protein
MIAFLSGMVTLGYFIAAAFFTRFWLKTSERLFLAFAVAFVLFGLNQAIAWFISVVSEPSSFVYALRIVGFVIILAAILDKNRGSA